MNTMMNALVKTEKAPGLTLTQVPVPTCGDDEVLIKIRKTAICGTDVHIYNWDDWSKRVIAPPIAVGHEYVGEVAAFGKNVTGLRLGQRVSGEGHIVCHQCRACRNGQIERCPNAKGVGVNRPGAFAEYLCIPAYNVMPVDESIPEEIVSFFDAYGNATHTVLECDVVGEDVLITGAGPIGIMAAAICRYAGARNVIITDLNDYRLDLAKKMGATAAVNVTRENLDEVARAHGVTDGFDVGLEMSGSIKAFNQMLKALRNGAHVAMLGLMNEEAIDWNDVILKCITLKGIYGRKMDTWHKMPAMIQGGLDLAPLITHRYNFREFEKGFEAMNSGLSGKVVLDWTE